MSYNPLPQPATSVVLTGAGTSVVTFANPFPVSLGSSSITINGNITIPTTVSVASSPANPIHNHITEVGTSDILNVPYLPVGIGTTNLNLTYLPVGISSLLNIVTIGNTVSISNTSFYITNPVTTVAVSSITSNVTVQGTVGIGTTGQVSLNLNSAPVSSSNPLPVSATIVSTASTTAQFVQFIDKTNTQLDSANRLRVSPPSQQNYYVPTVDKDGDYKYIESFVGTGCTSAFEQNLASIRYTSGISTNGYYTRGSRRRFKIRPGVSHQWVAVVNWQGRQQNCTKRRGLFTAFNGMFFEISDDLYIVTRRRLLDGTLVEDRVKRTSFNEDILDGNGASGYNFENVGIATITGLVGGISTVTVSTVGVGETYYNQTYSVANGILPMNVGQRAILTGIADTSYNGAYMIKAIGAGNTTVTLSYPVKPSGSTTITNGKLYHDSFLNTHTFWIDFNGDRTCRIRYGLERTEGTSVLHIVNYGDTLGTQFESAPSIMDRTEIFNTGISSYAPSMLVSGTSINTEAEVELNPYFSTASQNSTTTFTTGSGQTFPIIGVGIRTGEPYQRADIQIQNIQILDASAAAANGNKYPGNYFWRLTLNPTIGGTGIASTTLIGKASRQFTYTTGSTISGGIPLLSGYFAGQSITDVSTALNFLNMGSDLTYTTSDTIVLSVTEITGGTSNGEIVGSMNIIENL